MKILSNLFEKLGAGFAKGGPLERWYPFYEAVDSFLFHSSRTTQAAPHVRDAVDYKRIMITVLIALIPCTFMALWNTGYQANLGMQQMGISLPDGWRGAVMAWAGGCDPHSLLSQLHPRRALFPADLSGYPGGGQYLGIPLQYSPGP